MAKGASPHTRQGMFSTACELLMTKTTDNLFAGQTVFVFKQSKEVMIIKGATMKAITSKRCSDVLSVGCIRHRLFNRNKYSKYVMVENYRIWILMVHKLC